MNRFLWAFITIITVAVLIHPSQTMAFEQDEHQAINQEAVDKAINLYKAAPKFKNAPLDMNAKYIGPFTSSSSLFADGKVDGIADSYKVIATTNTLKQWIIHGGYSADEPHLYNSVRHFYDPLAKSGKHELTDHSTIHGRYDKAVPALEWGFNHADNPFNFRRALEYYKKSMEISEDGTKANDIPQANGNFRDMQYSPASKRIERDYYLGKAFRSLGETMHMLSDMAMPAHVRNDSHPNGNLDSIEAYLKPTMIHASANYPPHPSANLSQTPEKNFVKLATFTNATFFSNDTIHDKALGVMPGNGEPPYDKPKLTDFVRVENKGYAVLYKKFHAYRFLSDVPMVRESLATKIFGKELIGAGYSIPYYYASDYCDYLAPLAITASYKAFYDFFPSFSFEIEAKEQRVSNEEEKIGIRKKIIINSQLVHEVKKDEAWKEYGLEIKYSGPGELFRQSGNKKQKIADLIFQDGKLTKIRTSAMNEEFKAVDGPVTLYVWDSQKKIARPENFPEELNISNYIIDNDESVFITLKAGGRDFTSNAYIYKEEKIELEFEKKQFEGITFAPVEVKAAAKNEPRNIVYSWDFGDGTATKDTPKPVSEHKYEKEGRYTVKLRMLDKRNNSVLAEAQADIEVNNLFGSWSLDYTITEAKAVNNIINMFLKALIHMINMVFQRQVADPNTKVSIEGTVISCVMNVIPPPADNPDGIITVTLNQISSSTDYVKVNGETLTGDMVISKGEVKVRLFGAEQTGVLKMPFMTFKGKLNQAYITGDFNATVYSGTFNARKK
ncbi:MAG: PKD domain-containing protein [Clostridia bacterium]|nr:PKD domain-containing protein [Clostridia bacterium]